MKILFIILGKENPLQKKWISKIAKTDAIQRIEEPINESFFEFLSSTRKLKNYDWFFVCGENTFVNPTNFKNAIDSTDPLIPITIGRVGAHRRNDGSDLIFNSFSGVGFTFDVATKVQKGIKKANYNVYNDASLNFAEVIHKFLPETIFKNNPEHFLAHGLSHPENNGVMFNKIISVGNCSVQEFEQLNKTL